MIILSKMPREEGNDWILVKFEDNYYGYGIEDDLENPFGFSVDRCGTAEEVRAYCDCMIKVCEKDMKACRPEWKQLINDLRQEMMALTEFSKVLRSEKTDDFIKS